MITQHHIAGIRDCPTSSHRANRTDIKDFIFSPNLTVYVAVNFYAVFKKSVKDFHDPSIGFTTRKYEVAPKPFLIILNIYIYILKRN